MNSRPDFFVQPSTGVIQAKDRMRAKGTKGVMNHAPTIRLFIVRVYDRGYMGL